MNTIVAGTAPLYKRDSKGGVRVWRGEVSESEGNYYWRAISGLQEGKQVESGWKIVEQKNVGKTNETSLQQQAEIEMIAEFRKKLERGYFRHVEEIDNFEKVKPMLAAKYEDAKFDWENTEYFSQPKLDGIRCIARADGLWSRSGKEILAVPHIHEALKPYFYRNPGAILDGELYNHDLKDDFNKITSLVRKTKPKPEDIAEAAGLVEYHVYDLVTEKAEFKKRIASIRSVADNDHIYCVSTRSISSQQQMDELYGEYTEDGYEGQMIRTNAPYQQNKRSKTLLKRKEFITEEFKVLRVEEGKGNWAGHVKRFVLEKDGQEFGAGVRGNQEVMAELFESKVTPEWATLRYFQLTPDGIPRFPVVIDWGIGQRED